MWNPTLPQLTESFIIHIHYNPSVFSGTTTVIKKQNLKASDEESLDNSAARYVVVRGPAVGYLQLFKNRFVANITSSGESMFTQLDIDEGEGYNFAWHIIKTLSLVTGRGTFNTKVVGLCNKENPALEIDIVPESCLIAELLC